MTFKRRCQIKNEVVSVGVGVSGVTATEPEAVGGIVFITQAASERQKREWRLGAWGEWRRAERKGGFCIFWRAKLHEHSLLSQKFAKKPVYFVSARYAFTNQNLKISPMSPNGPGMDRYLEQHETATFLYWPGYRYGKYQPYQLIMYKIDSLLL